MVGPRSPVAVGLAAAEAHQHILRLLESSASPYSESMDGIWHEKGCMFEKKRGEWAARAHQQQEQPAGDAAGARPPDPLCYILSLNLSDDRTALVKTQSRSGKQSLYSLLRIDGGGQYYNGWKILRQLCQGDDDSVPSAAPPLAAIQTTLETYFAIEHGGGEADAAYAQRSLFTPTLSSLLTVGIGAADDPPASSWSASAGDLLEIPLETYVDGVRTQTVPHGVESSQHDAVLAVDILPCRTAAAATVLVGNGACSRLFCDHLLLGSDADGEWRILSKTFSVRQWPESH